jgi:hypothetical protein
VLDTVFYNFSQIQESTGTLYRIVENRNSNSKNQNGKYVYPIEGVPETYFFVQEGNNKGDSFLLKRYLNGRENEYYLMCNNLNLLRLQTWYPLNQPINLTSCSSLTTTVNYKPYKTINGFEIFSAKANVKLRKLEVEFDADILRQAKFIDLIVPKIKNKFDRVQIILIEPI